MPVIKVIGLSAYDFVDKTTKKSVVGISIHYNSEIDPRNGSGLKGEKISVGNDYVAKVCKNPVQDFLGKLVNVEFNKYGSVESLELVK